MTLKSTFRGEMPEPPIVYDKIRHPYQHIYK